MITPPAAASDRSASKAWLRALEMTAKIDDATAAHLSRAWWTSWAQVSATRPP